METKEQPNDSVVTIDNITQGENFPDVSPNAIKAMEVQKEKELEKNPPKTNKDGSTPKKRGRKPKSETTGQTQGLKSPNDAKQEEGNKNNIDSLQAATVISGTLENMSVVLISNEWSLTDVERKTNVEAWKQTLDHYGGVNLSPPMALALSHASIILTRAVGGSETKTKMQKAGLWFKTKFQKLRKKKDKNDAHADNRQDDVRKDDAGKKEKSRSKETVPSKV